MSTDVKIKERCKCDHLKSAHLQNPVGVPNHGACMKCKCRKFTWKSFVGGTDFGVDRRESTQV